MGRADLLLAGPTEPETRENLQFIVNAAEDGAAMVRRIQSFARKSVPDRCEAVEVEPLLRDALAVAEPRWRDAAQRRGVAIEVHLDLQAAPPVLGQPSELREVLVNLINNAADAMPQGGRLVLSCRAENDTVELRVADSGTGMSPEVQRRVFEPFFTTKGAHGAGLGLAVTYGIVARHGGSLDIDSAPGRGTTVRLRLPVAPPTTASGPVQPPPPSAARSARILVVDDDPRLGRMLATILEREGHTAVVRIGAAAALAAVATEPFDLVLSDLGMPDMSGLDLARALRRDHPGLQVALVTGWGDSIPEREWRAAGACGLLAKPYRLAQVRALLAAALPPVPHEAAQRS